jgi:hypothetical protein
MDRQCAWKCLHIRRNNAWSVVLRDTMLFPASACRRSHPEDVGSKFLRNNVYTVPYPTTRQFWRQEVEPSPGSDVSCRLYCSSFCRVCLCIPLASSSYIRYLVHYLPIVTVTVRGGPRQAVRNWLLRRTMNLASFGSLIWYFPSNLALPPAAHFTLWTGHSVYSQHLNCTSTCLYFLYRIYYQR